MGPLVAGPLDWIQAELEALESGSMLRRLRLASGSSQPEMEIDGRQVLQFSSNNYLGLSTHPRVIAAAKAALDRHGAGAGASRLISGSMQAHADLEAKLARLKGTEAALVFASGSAANLGALSALAGEGSVVWMDKACHATLYDGVKLGGAELRRFPHQDFGKLTAMDPLARNLVVVESLYSMDGDITDLPALLQAMPASALLIMDEAHSSGVLGKSGRGILEHFGLGAPENLLITGTLSKSLGAQGGFVAGPRSVIDFLINKSRSFLFGTALAPASAAAALEALAVMEEEPAHLGELLLNQQLLGKGLLDRGWSVKTKLSPIFPLVVGTAEEALGLQARLWDAGLYVPAIRPPTVPAGLCRLRVSITASHTPEQIERLMNALGHS